MKTMRSRYCSRANRLSIVAEGQGVAGGSGRLSVIHNNFPDGTTGKCLAATICGETPPAGSIKIEPFV